MYYTERECIDRSFVFGPLITKSRLELGVDRLKVDARYGDFAIFVQRGSRRSRSLGSESRRDGDGELGGIHGGR